jgi:SAM-dependent methyltransferase
MEYLIPVGERDAKRMDSMCSVFNPMSLEVLARFDPTATLLDVGCGAGGLTAAFAAAHPETACVGVDRSEDQIQLAAKHALPNLTWQLGDAKTLRMASQFDLVHTRFVLSHLRDPVATAEHLLSLVKAGGALVVEELARPTGIVFSHPHRAALAWEAAIRLQHELQGSSLETGLVLSRHFAVDAQLLCGKFDTPDKKMAMLEGVCIAVELLPKLPVRDAANPLVLFQYADGRTWIEETKALVNSDAFTFEWTAAAVVVPKPE